MLAEIKQLQKKKEKKIDCKPDYSFGNCENFAFQPFVDLSNVTIAGFQCHAIQNISR